MEPSQQNHANEETQNVGNGGGSGGAKGSFLCRQTSTRWTPTADQIRILKELYYTKGVRSPNADQIQKISARLRQYGKIEGKNVFYWFQNHKARERQKKRFTTCDHNHLVSNPPNTQQQILPRSSSGIFNTVACGTASPAANWKPEQEYSFLNPKFPGNSTFCPGASSSSSAGVMTNYGYGSAPMEKSFRDCSIGGSTTQNYGWIGCNTHDPYKTSYSFYGHKPKPSHYYEEIEEEDEQEEDQQEEASCEVETLPLFPVHREDVHIGGYFNDLKDSNPNYYYTNGGGNFTSLELSLNSFFGQSPGL